MHYRSPESVDLAEVRELNAAFLKFLCAKTAPGSLARTLQALDEGAREAIADSPFLLFELRSNDGQHWDRLFAGRPDLMDATAESNDGVFNLVASTLAFLWHLARRDLHAARLFSGLDNDWCRHLADARLVRITHAALSSGIRPVERGDRAFWDSVLTIAADQRKEVQSCIRSSALHAATLDTDSPRSWRSAACTMTRHASQVSED